MRALVHSFIALALLPLGAAAQRVVEETRPASPDARISIENTAGQVIVTAWDRQEVAISARLGDDVEKLDISGDRQRLHLEVEVPEGFGRRRKDIDAQLEVRVPAGARLSIETVSAPIEVTGITGSLEAESVSGSVRVSGSPREVSVETVSGTIEVAGETTRVSAESVSGGIHVEGAAERLDAATVSGHLDISADRISSADLDSVSGSVDFQGSLAPGARFDVEVHSGNVTLHFPAATSAAFDIETFSGAIDNELGPAAERTGSFLPGRALEFTLGDGEARVSIETFSGNVRLKKR